MEDCQTPTLAQVMDFKYELTPTVVFDPSRLQEAQNLIVNRINVRCFTPTIKNFQSPGLSPINECTKSLLSGVAVGVAANADAFQKPMPMAPLKEECFKAPVSMPKYSYKQAQIMQQQYQQQLQQKLCYGTHFVSDSPPIIALNSTTNSELDHSIDDTSPNSSTALGNNSSSNSSISFNNTSNTMINSKNNGSKNISITNLLDSTLNVSSLLRSVGLEQYTELFEQQDLEEFLNIRAEDFQRLGVRTPEHQKIILDLLSEFNCA